MYKYLPTLVWYYLPELQQNNILKNKMKTCYLHIFKGTPEFFFCVQIQLVIINNYLAKDWIG